MLQVWRHVFFIYFFYKFSFFSKNLFQQHKRISNQFEISFCCSNKFFEKKMLHNKRKILGDTQKFFMKLQQFEKFVAISWKNPSCPQSFILKEKMTRFWQIILLFNSYFPGNIHLDEDVLKTSFVFVFKTSWSRRICSP